MTHLELCIEGYNIECAMYDKRAPPNAALDHLGVVRGGCPDTPGTPMRVLR